MENQAAAVASAHRRARSGGAYTILNGLPDPLPVTDAELDLLERELGMVIEELLRG